MSNTSGLHSTQITTMNEARKELLEQVYSSFGTVHYIVDELSNTFKSEISFDYDKMIIEIKGSDITTDINNNITLCFEDALKKLYNDNKITEELYDKCMINVCMLFDVVFNYNKTIIVKI